MSGNTNDPGFFGALFDFSFKSFVTISIIKVLYVLALIGVVVGAVIFAITSITQGGGGMGALLGIGGAILLLFFGTIYARVLLELIIVAFRIAENTSIMARGAAGPAGPGPGPAGPGWIGTPGGSPAPSTPFAAPTGLGPPPVGPIGNG
jgi:hypothetical protein